MADVLAVLKQGMATEIWGQRFYEQAVARTASDDGKAVFQSLVDEESMHLDILRGEYAAVTGSAIWVTRDEATAMAGSVDPLAIFPKADATEQLIPEGTSDEQALQLAMDFEMRGYKLYSAAAEAAETLAEKAVWEWLAKAENDHYAFLQKTYDYMRTNGVWYFDDLEKPFFEG